MDALWFPLVRFNTKAVGKAVRAPIGEIQEVLVGFESRPVRLHVILKIGSYPPLSIQALKTKNAQNTFKDSKQKI